MLKGLALTPPVIGRIAIGKVVEKNGRRLPEKDDEFTVTSQVQNKDGWVSHPVDQQLRKEQPAAKLRSIPVRMLFDDPDLNLRANYTMFDRSTGRPLCVGDGEKCMRVTLSGMQSLPCPAPAACPLAHDGHCKPYGRLYVRIDADKGSDAQKGEGCTDALGSFIFRTTGFNSIRTLSARLRYLFAVSGGLLAGLPLELRLRGKSTTLSHRAPIYYVDLTLRESGSLSQVVARARQEREQQMALGLDQGALDNAARQGLALGEFEESEEEGRDVMEEFYPQQHPQDGDKASAEGEVNRQGTNNSALPGNPLKAKLAHKLQARTRAGSTDVAKTKATGDAGGSHAGT